MSWTREPPKEPGWYWARRNHNELNPLEVRIVQTAGGCRYAEHYDTKSGWSISDFLGLEWWPPRSSPRRRREEMKELERLRRLEAAVRVLVANEHVDLGDLVYKVREREGEGWEGPSVKAWSSAVMDIKAALRQEARP